MLNVIIFSFDRAMQLSLLLDSIKKFDTQRFLSVHVLYAFSSEEYKNAYERLKSQHLDIEWTIETRYDKPNINVEFRFSYWHNWYWWLKSKIFRQSKSNFKSCLIELLARAENPFTMFLTDDSLFYNPITIPDNCLEKIAGEPKKYSFSFRHGLNLKGGIYQKQSGYVDWNVYENDVKTDWGCPFSVDGHIYDSRTIDRIIKKILLNNPNTMEGNVGCYVTEKKLFPIIMASTQSCLVGFELNRVQSVANNHHLGISQEKLNQYYLEDYTLKINFDNSNVDYFRPAIQSLSIVKENKKIEIWNP